MSRNRKASSKLDQTLMVAWTRVLTLEIKTMVRFNRTEVNWWGKGERVKRGINNGRFLLSRYIYHLLKREIVITKYASKDQRKDLGIDKNFEVNRYIYIY